MSTNPKIFIKRLIEKLNDKDLIIEQQKSFIQQQDKMLELACKTFIDLACDCPNQISSAIGECEETEDKYNCITCWRKYLQSEVGK